MGVVIWSPFMVICSSWVPGPQHFHNEFLSAGAGVMGDELEGCSKLLRNVSRSSSTEYMLMEINVCKIIHLRVHVLSKASILVMCPISCNFFHKMFSRGTHSMIKECGFMWIQPWDALANADLVFTNNLWPQYLWNHVSGILITNYIE